MRHLNTPRLLFTAALLAAGSSAVAFHPPGAQEPAVAAVSDEATALVKEYDATMERFNKALREADRDTRKRMRANRPVYEFWPKFEALASGNDGVALLWMADNIKENKKIKKADRPKVLLPIFTALVEHHTAAPYFAAAMQSLEVNAELFEPTKVAELVKTAVDNVEDSAENRAQRGQTLLMAARTLLEIDRKTADTYIAEIEEKHGDQHIYTAAKALVTSSSDSQVGKVAPDFLGETIDGFKFKLEDYRGKVVVLDFYGFW